MSRQQAQAAMQRAQAGDQRIEELSSELTFALATLDELKAGLTSAGQAAIIARREAESAKKTAAAESEKNNERVSEVFREIIGLAARSGAARAAGGGSVPRRAELGKLRAKRESEIRRSRRASRATASTTRRSRSPSSTSRASSASSTRRSPSSSATRSTSSSRRSGRPCTIVPSTRSRPSSSR